MALTETLDIPARDGYALGATLYRPATPNLWRDAALWLEAQ